MSQENIRLLHNQLHTSQGKYTYFLLAVTASAIAFAVQITKESIVTCELIPLGIAVVFWGVSFYVGCRNIQDTNATIYSNVEYLKVHAGNHPVVGNNPQNILMAKEIIMESISKLQDGVAKYGKLQFRFAVAGGLMFIAWHIIKMFIRTYGN